MAPDHKHAEAFMLMEYVSADGSEREWIWNSRDGITPFIIPSATSDGDLAHVSRRTDRYVPDHTPKVGDRIFVDMTPQRARICAAMQVE